LRPWINLLIVGVICLLFGTAWAQAQILTRKGVISTNRVNLRDAPDLSGVIIALLGKNTGLTILDENNLWYKVRLTDEREGWVAKDYVVTNNTLLNRGLGYGDLISFAQNFLRTNYRYGGTSPTGFDCSGFTKYIFGKFGYSIPHKAAEQAKLGVLVSKADLLPGDLVFFTGRDLAGVNHVGIYIGHNRFIHAASGPGTVCINSLNDKYYQLHFKSARRITNGPGLFDLKSIEAEASN
jgi:cell wall-associated NlpC family hydrolase